MGDTGRKIKRKDRSPSPKNGKKNNGRGDVNAVETRKMSRSPSPPARFPPPPYYRQNQTQDQYTPLIAPIEHIFEVTRGEGFKKPGPLPKHAVRDRKKYCAYHEATGHDTHDCRQLKEEIERQIRSGKLTEWVVREVKRYKDQGTEEKNEGEEAPKKPTFVKEGSIHTIFEGPHIGGNGRGAMERYAREAKHPPRLMSIGC